MTIQGIGSFVLDHGQPAVGARNHVSFFGQNAHGLDGAARNSTHSLQFAFLRRPTRQIALSIPEDSVDSVRFDGDLDAFESHAVSPALKSSGAAFFKRDV